MASIEGKKIKVVPADDEIETLEEFLILTKKISHFEKIYFPIVPVTSPARQMLIYLESGLIMLIFMEIFCIKHDESIIFPIPL